MWAKIQGKSRPELINLEHCASIGVDQPSIGGGPIVITGIWIVEARLAGNRTAIMATVDSEEKASRIVEAIIQEIRRAAKGGECIVDLTGLVQ
jgi:hypothetical protein